jgi:hypothetical protein
MKNDVKSQIIDLMVSLGYSDKKRDLIQLGKYLGKLNGRKPYRWTYISSILKEHKITPGAPFQRAVMAGLAITDGTTPLQAAAHEVTVFSLDSGVTNAMVDTQIRYCRNCQTRFVPNHWARKFCYLCRPPKIGRI